MPNYKRIFIQGHSYFITIVTHDRQHILIKNIELLRYVFAESKKFYHYDIVAIVILPDHLHMIIEPKDANEYPKIISYLKRKFTYLVNKNNEKKNDTFLSESKKKKRESNIWQRRYYEHTIRDEKDFNLHLDYIHYNPVKHHYVQNTKEWEYSSFDKYFKLGWYHENWCDFSDDLSFGE